MAPAATQISYQQLTASTNLVSFSNFMQLQASDDFISWQREEERLLRDSCVPPMSEAFTVHWKQTELLKLFLKRQMSVVSKAF